jgi:hypothetical protein
MKRFLNKKKPFFSFFLPRTLDFLEHRYEIHEFINGIFMLVKRLTYCNYYGCRENIEIHECFIKTPGYSIYILLLILPMHNAWEKRV